MGDLLKKQFEIGRGSLLKDIEACSKEWFDIQFEGLPNTIHWQIGHILTAADNFLFAEDKQLPSEYNTLFGYGSKPSAWQDDVPSVAVLVGQLKTQLEQIKGLPNNRFHDKLPEPILGNNTFGELVSFTSFHELTHIGQVHIMRKLAENR